ncbi:S-layer homology domain-containing protein [Gorillibacterium sp. sgz500922]|uniref:S-layer homology domain-containing protein n=1 Tax=Gorillibacterium sp. sgz500922 TaxID=3446694 RepID=UPI003F66B45C
MAKATQKWLSVALVFSLLVALLPARVQAAGATILITGLYTTTDADVNAITGKPKDDSRIDRFTSNPIDLRANITGISEEQVQNIYYEIFNPDTKQTVVEKLNKAVLSGNQIIFRNVSLTEGLNRITIRLGTNSNGVTSQPGWAYLTSIANITNLKIGDEPFVDDGFYPKNPQAGSTNSLTITGKAQNSTNVEASAMGVSGSQSSSFPDGFFTFVVMSDDSGNNTGFSGFNLKPGDNQMVFVTTNSTTLSSFRIQRSFIFDNGRAFAFHTNVKGASDGDYQLLAASPTVNSTAIDLDTDLKIPLVNGAPLYDRLKISADGMTSPLEIDLSKLNPTRTTSAYNVYNLKDTGHIQLDGTHRKLQTVTFLFTSSTGGAAVQQDFTMTYVKADSPTVTFVGIGSPSAVKDIEFQDLSSATTISELPRSLRIKTVNADFIDVMIDNNSATKTRIEAGREDYKLDQMLNGQHKITITPLDSKVGPDPINSVSYTLQINVAPYLILTNLSKGQVFDGVYPFSDNLLKGRLVSVSQAEMGKVKYSFNDLEEKTLADSLLPSKDGQFAINTTGINFNNGLNTVKFVIYNNGKVVTRATFEFFYYKDSAPSFTSVYPVNDKTNDFIPGSSDDVYSTQLDKVTIKGQMAGATQLKLTARSNNEQGAPVYRSVTIASLSTGSAPAVTGGDGTGSIWEKNNEIFFSSGKVGSSIFETNAITLSRFGDTTLEFEITNASNIKVTRTLTIHREPLPFQITSPALITNSKGQLQANITSNYQIVQIVSEGADKITFNDKKKGQAKVLDPNAYSFTYELSDLKSGTNSISFTIMKGSKKIPGTLILNYANTPVEGARFKTKLSSSVKAFNNQIQIKFPKSTFLTRNDSTKKPALYSERSLLFGIANGTTGQLVDLDYDQPFTSSSLTSLLEDRTGRFQPASPLYYMDAGFVSTLEKTPDSPEKGGLLPFSLSLLSQNSGKTLEAGNFYIDYEHRAPADNLVTSEKGQLTLQYDPNITQSAWRYVTVMRFGYHVNETGKMTATPEWENLGGVVDSKKNTITVPFQDFGYYRVFYLANSWTDVINHPWARNELDALYAKGYMYNLELNSFVPNQNITRGEFATLLVKIFDLPLNYSGKLTFTDLQSTTQSTKSSDYRYIETAARAGIIRGVTDNVFAPTLSISRQDAAVMIARAAKLKMTNDPDKSLTALQKQFTDAAKIDYYARTSVEAVNKAKFITGKPNLYAAGTFSFDPLNSFTRAEAAVVAVRVLQFKGKFPK